VRIISLKPWILAIRPKTLPAGILPVIVGSALAYHDGVFSLLPASIALICAVLIQILTNFINEIYDFRKGADTNERLGPTRTVASGIITEQTMIRASVYVAMLTFALGMVLVYLSGIPILIIGLLSLIMAWAYTGGPYPLAYKGLGEIFVLLFFGIAAVCGTYFAQSGLWTLPALLTSLSLGLLSANLLSINNIRDIETDIKAHKMTIATRVGRKNAELLLTIQTVISYIPLFILLFRGYNFFILLPILSLPFAFRVLRSVKNGIGKELNYSLQLSASLLLLFGILLAIGLLLPDNSH